MWACMRLKICGLVNPYSIPFGFNKLKKKIDTFKTKLLGEACYNVDDVIRSSGTYKRDSCTNLLCVCCH